MDKLHSVYESTKVQDKIPFSVNAVTDVLMGDPLNLDISQIIHTPQTVIVKKARDEYMTERIIDEIKKRFEVIVTCRSDMVIFS